MSLLNKLSFGIELLKGNFIMKQKFLTLGVLAAALTVGSSISNADQVTDNPALLKELIQSDERSKKHRARDQYRHPFDTLTFFGLQTDMKVAEVFPGGQGGWYRRIIEPFIENTPGGAYFPVSGRSDWPEDEAEDVVYGTIDMALVFRAHGFLIYGEPAQDHVNDLFKMVRPGGYLGIVDHAGDETVEQDPDGANGYVNESYFRAMAEKAGFIFVKSSDVNRNPKDVKDYPRGLYSLPPSLRGPDKDKHRAIGESDRFTHVYRKPAK